MAADVSGILDEVCHKLDESEFLARRGLRLPAVTIAEPAAVGEVVARLCRVSRREMVSLHDPAASSAAAGGRSDDTEAGAAAELDRDMLRRGVVIQQVSAVDGSAPAASLAEARTLDDAGASIRLSPSVPFKLSMFDRSAALLPLEASTRTLHHGALLVRDPAVLGTLLAASRAAWAVAAPLAPSTALPQHLQPVVRTLLEGLVDTAAARRLGMSGRTYSRRVSELLGVLDVRSRAQIGPAMELRGWHLAADPDASS